MCWRSSGSTGWHARSTEEIVEHLLGGYTPCSWADLIAQPLMEDVPHDQIKEQLIKMGKAHLSC